MKNKYLIMLVLLGCLGSANGQSSQNLQEGSSVTQRTWEFDDGSSYNDLVILRGDDFEVLYTSDMPNKFFVTFSELWGVACDKPLPTQKERRALKALRGGKLKELTIETPFGSRTFTHEGERTVTLLDKPYNVTVISDLDLDFYFHKKSDELIGWYESVNELPTGLRNTQVGVGVNPEIVQYARENCDAGPLEN